MSGETTPIQFYHIWQDEHLFTGYFGVNWSMPGF
jgi:hypothetical protein